MAAVTGEPARLMTIDERGLDMPGLLVYLEDLHIFDGLLSNEDLGAVIRALAAYIETGAEAEELSPTAMIAYRVIRAKVDRDLEKYARLAENGAKGGRPKTQQNQTKPNNNQAEPNHNQTKPNNNQAEPNETNQNHIETESVTESVTEAETEPSATGGGAGARVETPFGEVTVDPLIVKVQRELFGLTDTHYDLLAQYRADMSDELVSYAIDEAVANGARKWSYVEGILLRLKSDGIRTVGEAKAAEERRRQKGRDAPRQVHAQQFTQRSYTDAELESGVSPLLAEAMARVKAEKAKAPA